MKGHIIARTKARGRIQRRTRDNEPANPLGEIPWPAKILRPTNDNQKPLRRRYEYFDTPEVHSLLRSYSTSLGLTTGETIRFILRGFLAKENL